MLSPILFTSYVNLLLEKLEKSGLGCFVAHECANSFMYADDLILLSLTVSDLQKLIDMCFEILSDLDLSINIEKSHCIRIGPRWKLPCSSVAVNAVLIKWVSKTKFLGITIVSDKTFRCDWHEARSNFYKASNVLFSHLGPNPQIDIILKLFNSKCLPI